MIAKTGWKLNPRLLLVLFVFLTGCDQQESVSIFIAGSLVEPFQALETAYETQNPDVDIQVEAHGSVQVIRHVTEIHDLIDIVIPADYRLIPMLMYPTLVSETGEHYANYALQIALNRLVLAYTPQSRYADEINADNWVEILARKDVKFGLSDPRFDAAGYRSLMILQLAEEYYQNPAIFEKVFLGGFKKPIAVQKEGERHIIKVPELLEIKEGSHIVMRGGSVALLALLESGDVDYAFEYESVARQHGLSIIRLPAELDLSDPSLNEWYSRVWVKLDYQRFSTISPEFQGEVITYGLTIPSNAPNPEEAVRFVEYLLGPGGRAIMEANFHPMLPAIAVDNPENLPESLLMLVP